MGWAHSIVREYCTPRCPKARSTPPRVSDQNPSASREPNLMTVNQTPARHGRRPRRRHRPREIHNRYTHDCNHLGIIMQTFTSMAAQLAKYSTKQKCLQTSPSRNRPGFTNVDVHIEILNYWRTALLVRHTTDEFMYWINTQYHQWFLVNLIMQYIDADTRNLPVSECTWEQSMALCRTTITRLTCGYGRCGRMR